LSHYFVIIAVTVVNRVMEIYVENSFLCQSIECLSVVLLNTWYEQALQSTDTEKQT